MPTRNLASLIAQYPIQRLVSGLLVLAIVFVQLIMVMQASATEAFPDGGAPQSTVVALIEIPAGTNQKWEQNKDSGQLEWEIRDGAQRVVDYLPYPGNYGMIERTLLPKSQGGDGDPIDVIVLGPAIERGSHININIIGILKLKDNGEQDDKLIAVTTASPFGQVDSIAELKQRYVGVDSILRLWFSHYKGPGQMEFVGFGERDEAINILRIAYESFNVSNAEPLEMSAK